MVSTVCTKDLLDRFHLQLVAGEEGVHREIITSDISRPGLEMTGFFDYYPRERLQLIGKTELAYFLGLNAAERKQRAENLCTDVTPGIIISRGMDVPEEFLKHRSTLAFLSYNHHGQPRVY